jgi:hypothetical protein
MLVESWRHLESRIMVAIMSHDTAHLPGIMSSDRYASIINAIEEGDAPAALRVVEDHMAAAADLYAADSRTPARRGYLPRRPGGHPRSGPQDVRARHAGLLQTRYDAGRLPRRPSALHSSHHSAYGPRMTEPITPRQLSAELGVTTELFDSGSATRAGKRFRAAAGS